MESGWSKIFIEILRNSVQDTTLWLYRTHHPLSEMTCKGHYHNGNSQHTSSLQLLVSGILLDWLKCLVRFDEERHRPRSGLLLGGSR